MEAVYSPSLAGLGAKFSPTPIFPGHTLLRKRLLKVRAGRHGLSVSSSENPAARAHDLRSRVLGDKLQMRVQETMTGNKDPDISIKELLRSIRSGDREARTVLLSLLADDQRFGVVVRGIARVCPSLYFPV